MRRTAFFAFCFAVSIATYACKGDDNKPPVSSDNGQATQGGGSGAGGREGGAGDASTIDGGDGAAAACNSLVNDADVVDQNRIAGDPPIGTGGTIPDGTYELTQADVYVGAGGTPGPSGVTYRGVLRLTTGKLERVTEVTASQGTMPVEQRTFGDVTAIAPAFTVLQSCPASFQDQYSYSVVNNTFNITSTITHESFTFTIR